MNSGAMNSVAGIVLAGGRASRMGGIDKALLPLGGQSLLARVCARATPQVDRLFISGNAAPESYAALPYAVLPDRVANFPGPLGGILAGLEETRRTMPDAKWLMSFACDTPFFPGDMVARMREAAEGAGASVAMAQSGGRTHPVFALISTAIAADSINVLEREGVRKVEDWLKQFPHTGVDFPLGGRDPFFNINTKDDLARAEAFLLSGQNG